MLEREKVGVRSLRSEDEPRLFALAGEAFGDALPASETVGVLTRCHVFVAETPDDIAGYVALVDEGSDLRIRQLLVATAHADTDRHVGDQLVDWCEGYAVTHGFTRVVVDVGDEERSALLFYRRRGYRRGRTGSFELMLPSIAGDVD